jgi:hypothetical protein
MKIEATKDSFHDNIFYFTYDALEGDSAVIDFGDGESKPIFPPRGQVTHQYDRDGKYTVKVSQGKKSLATATVTAKSGNAKVV